MCRPNPRLPTCIFWTLKPVGAVGHDAIILYTDDAGRTWTRQHADPGGESLLLTIHFFNDAHGFAMGDGSLILETKDGGASWKRHTAWRHTYGDFQLSDAFQSPKADTIYVAADFGALFRFKDTGPDLSLGSDPRPIDIPAEVSCWTTALFGWPVRKTGYGGLIADAQIGARSKPMPRSI